MPTKRYNQDTDDQLPYLKNVPTAKLMKWPANSISPETKCAIGLPNLKKRDT